MDDPAKYGSIEEVSGAWSTLNVGYSLRSLGEDGWGNTLVWEVRKLDSQINIRVLSKGSNGVYEGGNGDDLSIDVNSSKDGSVSVVRNLAPNRR